MGRGSCVHFVTGRVEPGPARPARAGLDSWVHRHLARPAGRHPPRVWIPRPGLLRPPRLHGEGDRRDGRVEVGQLSRTFAKGFSAASRLAPHRATSARSHRYSSRRGRTPPPALRSMSCAWRFCRRLLSRQPFPVVRPCGGGGCAPWDARPARASALLAALYPGFVFWMTWLVKDTLLVTVFAVSLVLPARWHSHAQPRSRGPGFLLVSGFLVMVRAYAGLSLYLGVAAFAFARMPRRMVLWGAGYALLALVVAGYTLSGTHFFSQLWASLLALIPGDMLTVPQSLKAFAGGPAARFPRPLRVGQGARRQPLLRPLSRHVVPVLAGLSAGACRAWPRRSAATTSPPRFRLTLVVHRRPHLPDDLWRRGAASAAVSRVHLPALCRCGRLRARAQAVVRRRLGPGCFCLQPIQLISLSLRS